MTTLACQPPGMRATTLRFDPLADDLAAAAVRWLPGRTLQAFVDECVAAAFPGAVLGSGRDHLVRGGEALKTLARIERMLDALVAAALDRQGVVVAVGGGSVGDAVGLTAALHRRGVDLVQVPTTLLAMVDSSVGGKTAINLTGGKNLAGHLWPAVEVWIDIAFLRSLPEVEWRSGLGEVAKIAIGLDAALFAFLEDSVDAVLGRDAGATRTIVEAALRAKIRIVEADPTELGPRRLLNLGHTLGHALEARSGYALSHGVAVARGLRHAIDVAETTATLDATDAARMRHLLARLGFDDAPLPPVAELAPFVGRDKKLAGGVLHAVLPTAIGQSEIVETSAAEFLAGAGPR